jgi:hypothetical protein
MSNTLESGQVQGGQVQEKKGELSEEARRNLEENAELWRAESEYVKLEDGETRILQFNPEKIKRVEGNFGPRIQYLVIDPNYSDKGFKKFEAGKRTSNDIDAQLRQGNRLIAVKRLGSGTDTKYSISPA